MPMSPQGELHCAAELNELKSELQLLGMLLKCTTENAA